MVSGVRLPRFIPIQGPTPDLSGDPTRGVNDGYLAFPKDKLYRSVPTPPGKGGDLTTLTQTLFPPPPLLEQNAAWQEVNKRLNANLKLNIVLNTDYRQRLSTTIAGGELPDLMYIVPIQSLPQFLQAKCANLTPYLSGDAVKDYPNLAALPTLAWKATVYSGGIYAVRCRELRLALCCTAIWRGWQKSATRNPRRRTTTRRCCSSSPAHRPTGGRLAPLAPAGRRSGR